jgi:hypothetical protein
MSRLKRWPLIASGNSAVLRYPALSCFVLRSLALQVLYCPEASSLYYALLFCSVLHSPTLSCTVRFYPALSCPALHVRFGPALSFRLLTALRCPVLSSTHMHCPLSLLFCSGMGCPACPVLSCTLMHCPPLSCSVFHWAALLFLLFCLALSCTVLHYLGSVLQ